MLYDLDFARHGFHYLVDLAAGYNAAYISGHWEHANDLLHQMIGVKRFLHTFSIGSIVEYGETAQEDQHQIGTIVRVEVFFDETLMWYDMVIGNHNEL